MLFGDCRRGGSGAVHSHHVPALALWAGRLVDRYGARGPLVLGPAIAALGFALFAVPGIGGSYWTTFFPAVLVLGFGMTMTVAVLVSKKTPERPLIRIYAQVVAGVRAEASLFRQLLTLNTRMRFGAFAYVPDGSLVLFAHTILGG